MSKKCSKDKNVDLLLIEGEKDAMLLSKILAHSNLTIHNIVEENILVVIVHKLLEQQTY